MKLATYFDGSRDGQLVVISADLTQAHYASGIAGRLQTVLDDWNFYAPQLQELALKLQGGQAPHAFTFDPKRCMAPLPRAYQRLCGVQSEEVALVLQGPSDAFSGAHAPIYVDSTPKDLDFVAGLAVITADVAEGASVEQAQEAIRLITLINELYWCLPSGQVLVESAMGPLAMTPEELGAAWQGSRVCLTMAVSVDARRIGLIDTGQMRYSFAELIAQAARMKALSAGTIVTSGLMADADEKHGHASLSARNAALAAQGGTISGSWLRADQTVRIELKASDGTTICGSIEQTLCKREVGEVPQEKEQKYES